LLLTVADHTPHPLLVPSLRKSGLLHLLPFRRRRRRNAIGGLPRSLYALTMNMPKTESVANLRADDSFPNQQGQAEQVVSLIEEIKRAPLLLRCWFVTSLGTTSPSRRMLAMSRP
jgi:hypothetical protein